MRKLAALFWLVLAFTAQAADVTFIFALPELDGRITLGVFDAQGRLVRNLYSLAEVKDFGVADNGLIAKWDGRNDSGESLPAGAYFVRGYLVGDAVEADGNAYHFNDWIVDEASPRITWIQDFQRLDDGGVVALADDLGGRNVFRYEEKSGFLWQEKLTLADGSMPALLASNSASATLACGKEFVFFNLSDGKVTRPAAPVEFSPMALALDGEKLFLAEAKGITETSLPDLKTVKAIPASAAFDALAAAEGRLLAGVKGKSGLWIYSGDKWTEMALPASISSLSPGPPTTVWVVGQEDGKKFVGQFSAEGEFLRSYQDELVPQKVSASRTAEEVAVLEQSETQQRLLGLRLLKNKNTAWEITFDKRIVRCARFGLKEGKLVPDAGTTPQTTEMTVQTSPGGLSEKGEKLVLQVAAEKDGCWLKTSTGLRLLCVTERSGMERIAVEAGTEAGTMKIYAGDGAVVSEYLVTGLNNIVVLNVGEIDLP